MDHEVIPTDYVVLRKDRIGGRLPAGGVLLAVLPHLQPRRQKQLETSAEAIWAAITVSNLRFLIASVYRAPNSTAEQNDELLRSFSLAAEQQHNYDACFVMGDLNLDIDWSAEPPLPRAIPAEKFIDAFDNLAFFQLIKNPTRTTATSEKTIDLFLCGTPNLVSSSEVIAGVSDHDALLAELRVDSCRPTPLPAMLPNWRRAPWPKLNDLIFFKKSLCGLTQYNAMARITEGRVNRGDDPLHPRLQQQPARTELGQNAFDYRIVAEWNAAPPAIKDCTAAQFPAVCKADGEKIQPKMSPCSILACSANKFMAENTSISLQLATNVTTLTSLPSEVGNMLKNISMAEGFL
ncbi:Hypothetical predicted protein [Cloeon dipterum]|uniref:Endonuclease/exonuclease/phosphatase domain-containing protein n=1 Tax=Cloeon dipterum TaxID=197152 RepID=A0A8S1E7H7_9INSE|nr:Hypothetical predicted protein [Cloeon dipterum]CAB3388690.1 Hypothetical predicted protein [Cloeon dipterum]